MTPSADVYRREIPGHAALSRTRPRQNSLVENRKIPDELSPTTCGARAGVEDLVDAIPRVKD